MHKLIIFPTDTVYGIGCSIYDKTNQDRIYEIKNRSKDKPLAVLCANVHQIEEIAEVSLDARKLICAFLPGPLTLILPAKPRVKEIMNLDTIGVRIPNHKLALDILEEMGPMTTTSVNESGSEAMNEYEDILNQYSDKVDYIYPPTAKSSSLPSTIISTNPKIKLIRQGAITLDQINEIIK